MKELTRRDFLKVFAADVAAGVVGGGTIGYISRERTLSPLKVFNIETPKSEIVDGIEVYGKQRPLNQNEFEKLMLSTYEETAYMAPDTYYATFNFAEEYVTFYETSENESVVSFIKRHTDKFTDLLVHDPRITSMPKTAGGLVTRRIVITKNNVVFPESVRTDYPSYGFKDSDGVWNFTGSDYLPEKTSYYSKEDNIDYGLLHEWGHRIFHLPDMYSLDFEPPEDHPVLADMPKEVRQYLSSYRNDIGRGLMSAGENYLGLYEATLLSQRAKQGKVHNFEFTLPEVLGFPLQVPRQTVLDLGERFAGATYQVYRTEPVGSIQADRNRILPTKALLSGQVTRDGHLDMGYPFIGVTVYKRGNIPIVFPSSSDFLVKIYKDGELYTRWMDITDFNRAYWAGYKNKATMHFNLFDRGNIAPLIFDWRIKYF